MKRCWDKRYPWPHNKQQGGWYHERCEQDCNKEYNACEEEKEKEEARQQEKLTFSRMDEAVAWLATHKAEVALGAIVVVAGVAFVFTTGGAGALILVPLALCQEGVMLYNKNFDVDSVLEILRAVDEKYQEGSPEDEAIRIAAVALFYVRESQKLDEYREFFQKFYTPAAEHVVPLHSFDTRAAADQWLATGEARDGDLVKIAGEGFRVIPRRDGQGLRFRPTPLPDELDQMPPVPE